MQTSPNIIEAPLDLFTCLAVYYLGRGGGGGGGGGGGLMTFDLHTNIECSLCDISGTGTNNFSA